MTEETLDCGSRGDDRHGCRGFRVGVRRVQSTRRLDRCIDAVGAQAHSAGSIDSPYGKAEATLMQEAGRPRVPPAPRLHHGSAAHSLKRRTERQPSHRSSPIA